MYTMTLCFLVRGGEVLLARKEKHTFGYGTWNGYGGKVEPGESVAAALLRELQQESKVATQTEHLEHVATIDFSFVENPEWNQVVYVYLVRQWSGTPADSGEMVQAQWFPFADVPYDSMWPADRYWLPMALQGKKVRGYCQFANTESKKVEDFIFAPVQALTKPALRR